jgi:hypothetical protein
MEPELRTAGSAADPHFGARAGCPRTPSAVPRHPVTSPGMSIKRQAAATTCSESRPVRGGTPAGWHATLFGSNSFDIQTTSVKFRDRPFTKESSSNPEMERSADSRIRAAATRIAPQRDARSARFPSGRCAGRARGNPSAATGRAPLVESGEGRLRASLGERTASPRDCSFVPTQEKK